MIVPLLVIVVITVVLYQFRGLFIKLVNTKEMIRDQHEAKIMDDLNIKRLCIKCGGDMEAGEALIHFWSHDPRLSSFEILRISRSFPRTRPMASSNPFHRQIMGQKTYYCPKCQLFELNPS